jgi:CRP/FNR family transcriptional regulator
MDATNPCAACAVREQAVCAAMPPEDLDRLIGVVRRISLDAEQILCLEGEAAKYVYSINGGIARLTKMLPDGRRLVTAFLHPGNLIGLAGDESYACTAEAVTPLELCRFPRVALNELLSDYPEMEKRLLAMACGELWLAQTQLLLLGRKTARERLTTFLWNWISRARPEELSGQVIELPMARADIADHLGLTPETISRVFTALVEDGIVEIPAPNRIALARPDRLAEIASGAA